MDFNLKTYKLLKIKHFIKTKRILFFFHGISTNNKNWVKIEQTLINHGLHYYRIYNSIATNTLNNSIFKSLISLINGPVILINDRDSKKLSITPKKLKKIKNRKSKKLKIENRKNKKYMVLYKKKWIHFGMASRQNEQTRPNFKDAQKLSGINERKAALHISPIDYTKELLNNEAKDRRLFRYAAFYAPKDFHDRYLFLAFFLLLLSYLLSLVSTYLSFPFLYQYLSDDVPNSTQRFYVVLALLLFVEIVKHLSLATAFKTRFTY